MGKQVKLKRINPARVLDNLGLLLLPIGLAFVVLGLSIILYFVLTALFMDEFGADIIEWWPAPPLILLHIIFWGALAFFIYWVIPDEK
ncbi:MAG: hypothetical protein AAF512_14720 [Pseudomonadota bacterium]